MRGTDVRAERRVANVLRTLCVIPLSVLHTPVTSLKMHGRPPRASLKERTLWPSLASCPAQLTNQLTLSHWPQVAGSSGKRSCYPPSSSAQSGLRSAFHLQGVQSRGRVHWLGLTRICSTLQGTPGRTMFLGGRRSVCWTRKPQRCS